MMSLDSTCRHRCPVDAVVRLFLDDFVPRRQQRIDAGQVIDNPLLDCVDVDPGLWAVTPATTWPGTIRLVPTST
jgi:hypothetical protein